VIADAREMASYDEPSAPKPPFLSFEEYCALANRYPLKSLKGGTIFDDDEAAMGRLKADPDFARLPWHENSDSFWSEAGYFGAQVAFLSAETMLLIFGLCM
jgi:hypothetical protein